MTTSLKIFLQVKTCYCVGIIPHWILNLISANIISLLKGKNREYCKAIKCLEKISIEKVKGKTYNPINYDIKSFG